MCMIVYQWHNSAQVDVSGSFDLAQIEDTIASCQSSLEHPHNTQAYVSGLLAPVVDRVLNFDEDSMSHFDM